MATLYGPSDVISFKHANGHGHKFLAADREAAPGFGDTERSLPTLDCLACAVWCQKQGWSSHPSKVQLTADEQDYEANSLRQGSMNMQLAAQAMGAALARNAREEQAPAVQVPAPRRRKATSSSRPARAKA
jgi:hypothetical protein